MKVRKLEDILLNYLVFFINKIPLAIFAAAFCFLYFFHSELCKSWFVSNSILSLHLCDTNAGVVCFVFYIYLLIVALAKCFPVAHLTISPVLQSR